MCIDDCTDRFKKGQTNKWKNHIWVTNIIGVYDSTLNVHTETDYFVKSWTENVGKRSVKIVPRTVCLLWNKFFVHVLECFATVN